MTYTKTEDPNTVIRDADRAFIPADQMNRDYQAYLVWVGQGNVATTPAGLTQINLPIRGTS